MKDNKTITEAIKNSTTVTPLLPFIHIADSYDLSNIVSGKNITPFNCEVFQEKLSYFFYGRPAYKTRNSYNQELLFDFPVVFVLKPHAISKLVKRIFPFDTGAYHNGMYKNYFHARADMNTMQLEPNMESITKYVGHFYTSNVDYLRGKSTKNVDIGPLDFDIQGLHELARLSGDPTQNGTLQLDERSSSIEIQVASDVNLVNNTIAIIIPNVFFDVPEFKKKMSEIKPQKILPYFITNGLGPEGMASVIYEKTMGVYEDEGYLS